MAIIKRPGEARWCNPIAIGAAAALATAAVIFFVLRADLHNQIGHSSKRLARAEELSESSALEAAPAAAAEGAGAHVSSAAASTSSQCSAALPSWRQSPHVGDASYLSQIPVRQLDRGLLSYGSKSRARRLAAKLLEGKPITVGIVGGSISFKDGEGDTARYSHHLAVWLNQTFPKAAHRVVNGALPATPSSYFALCCYWHVPEDADLVIIELNINDVGGTGDEPIRRSHERLIRKLLSFKSRPAVLELLYYLYPGDPDPANPNGWVDAWHKQQTPFRWFPGDDENGLLATFYHLPLLSIRGLFWDYFKHTRKQHPHPANLSSDWLMLYQNYNHPNELGHRFIADLLIYWMQQMLDDVARHPLEAEDEQEAQEELPEPLYKHNYHSAANTCMVGDRLKQLVTAHDDAWEWKNEGTEQKPKLGYISTKPGSALELTVSTNVTPSSKEQGKVALGIASLRSYENMGQFQVECIRGCTCTAVKVDGLAPEDRTSQLQINQMDVSISDECVLKVTVLPETRSGQHKVKLLGVIVSEVADFLVKFHEDHTINVNYGEAGKIAEHGVIDVKPAA